MEVLHPPQDEMNFRAHPYYDVLKSYGRLMFNTDCQRGYLCEMTGGTGSLADIQLFGYGRTYVKALEDLYCESSDRVWQAVQDCSR